MRKLTQKQRDFCLAYALSGNATAAYKEVYSAGRMKAATVNRKATELMNHGMITARVAELDAEARARHSVTVDSITKQLQEDRALAHEEKSPAAAISASMGLAKLHGLLRDKVDVNGNLNHTFTWEGGFVGRNPND